MSDTMSETEEPCPVCPEGDMIPLATLAPTRLASLRDNNDQAGAETMPEAINDKWPWPLPQLEQIDFRFRTASGFLETPRTSLCHACQGAWQASYDHFNFDLASMLSSRAALQRLPGRPGGLNQGCAIRPRASPIWCRLPSGCENGVRRACKRCGPPRDQNLVGGAKPTHGLRLS
jgi:hypothetical protein